MDTSGETPLIEKNPSDEDEKAPTPKSSESAEPKLDAESEEMSKLPSYSEEELDAMSPADEIQSVNESFAIGASALRIKRFDMALTYLTRAIELAESIESGEEISTSRRRGGRRSTSSTASTKELDENSMMKDMAKLHMFLARALQLQGRHDEAIAAFTRSIESAESFEQAPTGSFILRAKSYRETNQPEAALEDYGVAVERDPQEVSIYIGRAALYMIQQQWELALSDCQRALELDPKHVVAHRRCDLIFAETGHLQLAVRAFNRALSITADYEGLSLRGKAFVQLGEFDRALADYTLAIQVQPQVPRAYGHRSVLHLKRLDKAVNDASSFIQLAPRDQSASALQNRGVWLG